MALALKADGDAIELYHCLVPVLRREQQQRLTVLTLRIWLNAAHREQLTLFCSVKSFLMCFSYVCGTYPSMHSLDDCTLVRGYSNRVRTTYESSAVYSYPKPSSKNWESLAESALFTERCAILALSVAFSQQLRE